MIPLIFEFAPSATEFFSVSAQKCCHTWQRHHKSSCFPMTSRHNSQGGHVGHFAEAPASGDGSRAAAELSTLSSPSQRSS